MTGQLLDQYTAAQVFSGGLKIKTTIDPELQAAAEQAIAGRLAGVGPSASLVAIENETGEVQRDGGRQRLRRAPVQPRHQRAPPAGIGDQAVHPRARRSPTASTRTAPGPRSRRSFPVPGSPDREVRGQQLRGLLPRHRLAVVGHRRLGQLGVRRARPQGRHQARRAARAQDGHPHEALDQPRDDARRPQGGRHPARDGVRLLDDRQRGRAGHGVLRAERRQPGRLRGGQGGRLRRAQQGHARARVPPEGRRDSPRRCSTWS